MKRSAFLVLAGFLALAGCGGSSDHRSYATPEAAVAGLVSALESGDPKNLAAVFGPESGALVSSGDSVQDALDRRNFLDLYQAKHAIAPVGNDESTLTLGPGDWPFPVPLVKKGGRWSFDGAAGAQELSARRVGRNEIGAIAVSRGFVRAERDYSSEGRDGAPAGIFAQKLLSDPGSHDGLYWRTGDDEAPSPVGEFVAQAAAEGYRAGTGQAMPYHGYYYRMLFKQGEHATGGAAEYFVGGQLVGGFALLAWPAQYGVSGVQTFTVNQDGVVYQKDLGDDTAALAEKIEAFDPDATWTVVPEDSI